MYIYICIYIYIYIYTDVYTKRIQSIVWTSLSLSLSGHTANRRLTLSALSARRLMSISNQSREAEQGPVQMDPLCSHSAALGTAEVPPKGTARAKDRQGSRRSQRRRRNGRRPKEGGQGPGAAGGANGQTGRCSGPMFRHFLFGKQKVQKHWAGVTPRQATRGQKGAPGEGGQGTGRGRSTHGPTEGSRGRAGPQGFTL